MYLSWALPGARGVHKINSSPYWTTVCLGWFYPFYRKTGAQNVQLTRCYAIRKSKNQMHNYILLLFYITKDIKQMHGIVLTPLLGRKLCISTFMTAGCRYFLPTCKVTKTLYIAIKKLHMAHLYIWYSIWDGNWSIFPIHYTTYFAVLFIPTQSLKHL